MGGAVLALWLPLFAQGDSFSTLDNLGKTLIIFAPLLVAGLLGLAAVKLWLSEQPQGAIVSAVIAVLLAIVGGVVWWFI